VEPLIALEGGPKHGQWYRLDDLTELQAATRRTANQHTPRIALAVLHYQPTGRQITRHIGRDRDTERIATADIYTYRPDGAA
jgi:hypothetical protein